MKREERKKMGEVREEIGMKKHLRMKVVGSRLLWTGLVQKITVDGHNSSRGWNK